MSIFNRVITILFAVVLVVIGLIAFYVAMASPTESATYVQGWAYYLADQVTIANRLLVGAVAAVSTAGGLLMVLLERPKRAKTAVQLKRVNGGQGVLSVGAIAQRVQHDAELLGGVRRAKPVVFGRGNKVDIRLDLTTDPYVEAAAKTQDACQMIRDNVEGQMGVKVRRITVRINHDPIREGAPGRPTSDVA